jgi:branched-chain amino acid transport system permease protein
MNTLLQVLVTGVTIGGFYALVALGYTMVYGIVRLINFAHGDLVMVGAMVGWVALNWDWVRELPSLLGIAVAGIIAIVATVLLGLLILRVVYWPLIGGTPLGFMIVALAVAIVLREVARLSLGADQKIYPTYGLTESSYEVAGVRVTGMDLVVICAAAVLMAGMLYFSQRTTMGLAMRSLAVDHGAARLMGVNVPVLIGIAFGLGACLAAITGILSGAYYQRVGFDMGFMLGLKAFIAAVVGGIGNIGGAVVGGLMIGILEAFIQGYFSGTWSDALVFGALILVLYVRPTGLLGERVAVRA